MKHPIRYVLLLFGTLMFILNLPTDVAYSDNLDLPTDRLEYQIEIHWHEYLNNRKTDQLSTLDEFRTDGCSGGLSIGWKYLAEQITKFESVHGAQPPWELCCVIHDMVYHSGGDRTVSAKESFELRKEADQALKECVLETGVERMSELSKEYNISAEEVRKLYVVIGTLMYRAVRIGGIPCSGLPWRWGYGWPECE